MTPAENDASDVSEPAMTAYRAGADPLDYAECLIAELCAMHAIVIKTRIEEGPDAFPGYGLNLGLHGLSRRIIGELLDAGWSAPVLLRQTDAEEPT